MIKLLLLEDDLSLIDGLTYSLNKAGYEVDVSRTVGEALERLREPDCFALLLLDVTLPDGTGFSVCEQVRERGSTVPRMSCSCAMRLRICNFAAAWRWE